MKHLTVLLAAAALAAVSLHASAQDPAYVNGSGSSDPLRASSPMQRPAPRGGNDNGYGVPVAPLGSGDTQIDSLQRIETLREQLGRQSQENGTLLPDDQRGALAQLLDQSGGLVQQARGSSALSGVADPDPLDFNAVQSDPRVQAGARQAKAAMETLERSLLPMLQDFKNKFDAALSEQSRANGNQR